MFGFIVLLSFGGSLTTKCLSLNDEPYMVSPTFIDLTPVELNYYPFMINVVEAVMLLMNFLQKYVFREKQKT